MHRCLEVPEIQSLIFGNFDYSASGGPGGGTTASGKSTLLRLALMCSTFTDSALTELWRFQNKLLNLLVVLPGDLWTKEDKGKDHEHEAGIFKFVREVRESDLPRFDFYATRMRSLALPWKYDSSLEVALPHPDVLLELLRYRPTQTLLQNLRTLELVVECKIPIHTLVSHIVWPSITHFILDITWPHPDSDLPELFETMARMCPHIKKLEFGQGAETLQGTKELHAFERFLCSLTRLQHVETNTSVTPAIVEALASQSDLQILKTSNVLSPDICKMFTTKDGQFLRLTDLTFAVFSLHDAGVILASLQCPLGCLVIEFWGDMGPPSSMERFMELVHKHTLVSSLRWFVLEDQTDRPDVVSPTPLANALRLLFAMKALQYIRFRLPYTFGLDDSWIRQAASAWPHLRELTLDGYDADPQVTLPGLMPLKSCLDLETLHVSVFAKPLNTGDVGPSICNKRLTSVTFGRSGIEDWQGVSRSLLFMFPFVGYVEGQGRDAQEDKWWDEVHKFIEENRHRS